MSKKRKKKKFDKFKELTYIVLWITIVGVTIGVLSYFQIRDFVIGALILINVLLLISNYLKSKEIESLKK